MDFVDAGQLDHQLGVLGGERLALAALPPLVAMRQVEPCSLRAAVHQQIGVRRFEAGQVVELVGLPEDVEALDVGGALKQDDRVVADRFEDHGPPSGELFRWEVRLVPVGELGVRDCRSEQRRQEDQGTHRH